jgi:ribosomal protein S18 acetylase RimI-like enzyme
MTTLRPLAPASFPAFFDTVTASYANDNVASGRWIAAEALELARAETAALLAKGPNTPNHHLFEIEGEASGEAVGFLWFATLRRGRQAIAYRYQLFVLPEHRRRGHARAALRHAADIAARQGHRRLELHVFGHNAAAQALYRSLGYEITSVNMALPLVPG